MDQQFIFLGGTFNVYCQECKKEISLTLGGGPEEIAKTISENGFEICDSKFVCIDCLKSSIKWLKMLEIERAAIPSKN